MMYGFNTIQIVFLIAGLLILLAAVSFIVVLLSRQSKRFSIDSKNIKDISIGRELHLLKERYEHGEISEMEYKKIKEDIIKKN